MSKKMVSILCIMVGLSLLFTVGCSTTKKEDKADSTPTTTITEEKPTETTKEIKEEVKMVKMQYSFWGTNEEISYKKDLVDKYVKMNPNVSIDCTYTGGGDYPTKLQTFFSSGIAPDIIAMSADSILDWSINGVFENLKPFMEKTNTLNKWSSSILVPFTYEGNIYAAPTLYKAPAIIYNKTLFSKAGLPFPTEDWTEEQFLEYAKKLTYKDDKGQVWGYLQGGLLQFIGRGVYGQLIYDTENYKMTCNNEQFRDGLKFLTDLVIKYKVSPKSADIKAAGGGFETGRYGMALSPGWEIQSYQTTIKDAFEWDYVTFPKNAKYGTWKSPLWADGISMYGKAPNKDEAWKFIEWTTTDLDVQKEVAKYAVPALKEFTDDPAYATTFPDGWIPYNKMAYVKVIDNSFPFYFTGVWQKIGAEFNNQIEMIYNNKTTVDEAVKYLESYGNPLLEQEKQKNKK